jgi:LacI family transcriptional regulator
MMDKLDTKPVVLRQVAQLAGVSASTASLVLNAKGDFPQATRDRVLEAASKLNYTPRTSKSKPSTTRTLRFIKISKHGETVNRDHNHFISDYIDGMSMEATRRNYALEVVTYNAADLSGLLSSSDLRNLYGAIILGTELSEQDIQILAGCGAHVIFVDTFYPQLNANFVDMDNDQTVFAVTCHIKEAGFARVGFVGSDSDVTNFRLREDAFRRACDKLDIKVRNKDRISVTATRDGAYKKAKSHLLAQDSIADVYFCVNDIVAFGMMRALQELDYAIPADVSVYGFDNLPMSSLLSPSLSTVDVPKQQIGAMAVRLLDDMIVSGTRQSPMKVLVTGQLILRKSTRKLPAK